MSDIVDLEDLNNDDFFKNEEPEIKKTVKNEGIINLDLNNGFEFETNSLHEKKAEVSNLNETELRDQIKKELKKEQKEFKKARKTLLENPSNSEEISTTNPKLDIDTFEKILNDDGKKLISSLAEQNKKTKIAQFINKLKKMKMDVSKDLTEYELAQQVIDSVSAFGSLLKNVKEAKNNFKINDKVSVKVKDTYYKGIIVKIDDTTLTIKNNKGDLQKVPKKGALKMFKNQKYDIREIKNQFPIQNVKFEDLKKSDRLALLKGEETGLIKMISKNSKKEVKIVKTKIVFNNTKLKIVKGYNLEDKIFGKKLKPSKKEKLLKEGKIIHTVKIDGKKTPLLLKYDSKLKKVRVFKKSPITENQKLTETLKTKNKIKPNKLKIK